ncbi:hypothetical protein DFS34DRAFT_229379 [Phlyctochytrium arcticum]|nr:hypothetical protein DFS34DRAFT_229379 [Phlyctochytrium arcticum]
MQMKNIVFNPLLSTIEDIEAFLRTKPNGTAHPFNRVLLVRNGEKSERVDLTDKPEEYFLDNTQLNALGGVLGERMSTHEAHLTDVTNYEIVTPTEPIIDISFQDGKITILALSLSDQPSFYDLVAINSSDETVCFNPTTNRHFPGLKHSGDITRMSQHSSVLLHTIIFDTKLGNQPFVIGLSGYQGNALHRYKTQNPAVLLVDHDSRISYLIPVPLDEATIGNATLCFPLVGRRMTSGSTMRFKMLSNPPTHDSAYASGKKLPEAHAAVEAAIEAATRLKSAKAAPSPDSASNSATVDEDQLEDARRDAGSRESQEPPSRTNIILSEIGLSLRQSILAIPGEIIRFDSGISTEPLTTLESIETHKSTAVIPCCLGNVLEGGKILSLGKAFKGDLAAFHRASSGFEAGSVPLVIVSDHMTDQCRLLNPNERVNGLFIIQPRATYNPAILDRPDEREKFFSSLNVNAITALAGPQSIVVIDLGGNYFFYRGISWPGIVDIVPGYGEDVSSCIAAILETPTLLRDASFAWPIRMSLGAQSDSAARTTVYLGSQAIEVANIAKIFSAMDLQTMLDMRPAIQDVLTQLQTILSSNDVNKTSGELIGILKKKFRDATTPFREPLSKQVIRCISIGSSDPKLKAEAEAEKAKLHAALRGAEREAKEATQWLIDGLGTLVSSRASSTKGHDLNQILKKTTMANNVANAQNMAMDDVAKILSEKCSKIGVVLGNVNGESFKLALPAVAENRFLAASMATPAPWPKLITTSAIRSSDEISALLPHVSALHRGPLASNTQDHSQLCFAVPQLSPESDMQQSAIPWPCFDRYVNLSDASNLYWPEESLNGDVASLRILVRGTIAAASQHLGAVVTPQNKDLGFMMIAGILDLMDDMVSTIQQDERRRIEFSGGAPIDKDTFDDPLAQALRGLFGQLFTIMASGSGKPLSMAWQMIMKNPKLDIPPADEMRIYARLVTLFPESKWPLKYLRRNVRLFLIRAIRQKITDPVTSPIRAAVASMKQAKDSSYLAARNTELAFVQIAYEVIRHLKRAENPEEEEKVAKQFSKEEVKAVAARVLSRMTTDGCITGAPAILFDYFTALSLHGCVSEAQERHVAVACANVFHKRAAHYKKAKKRALKSMREDNPQKAATTIEQMKAEKDRLQAEWGVDKVNVQNLEPYDEVLEAAGSASAEQVAKVSGDAEIVRIPWRVLTGQETPKSEISKEVALILGDNAPTNEASDPNGAAPQAVRIDAAVPTLSLEGRFREMNKGTAAANLCRDMEKWSLENWCTSMCIPLDAAGAYLRCINKESTDLALEFFKDTAQTLLEGWQDTVAAELKAVADADI